MARTLKRLSDSRWNYQPVGSIDVGELHPDAGQLGRGSWEAFPQHEDTNASSNYAPPPDVVQSPIPSTRGRFRTYNRFATGHPNTVAALTHNAPTGRPIWNTSGGQNAIPSGAPSADVIQTQVHDQLDEAELVGMGIPKKAQKPGFFKRLFGISEKNLEDDHAMALGENLDGSTRNTAINEVGQFFQVPNLRQIPNTPAIPGVAIINGRPYSFKAGTPTTDPEFAPEKENVRGNVVANLMPYNNAFDTWIGQSNRTRAGDQDPRDPMNRPSKSKALYGPYFERKFDQAAATSLTGMKVITNSPLAARPIATEREQIVPPGFHYGSQGGDPSRTTAPGMTPIGPLPNTDRQIPGPWDYDLNAYSSGDPGRRRYGRG